MDKDIKVGLGQRFSSLAFWTGQFFVMKGYAVSFRMLSTSLVSAHEMPV